MIAATMNILRDHGPVFLLILAVVFAAFGGMTTTPLWDNLDAQILCDAHRLAADPSPMFGHIGFYFSQPLLQLAFLAEHHLFGTDIRGYLAVNLVLHAANAFLVYMLVNMLFPKKQMAVLAALMFALSVGSYGRVFTTVYQLEALMVAGLHLLVLYLFIRNDFRHESRLMSPLFVLGLVMFLATSMTKSASFSLIGCLIAYKAFFYQRRRRAILSPDILVFVAAGILFYLGQYRWGSEQNTIFGGFSGQLHYSLLSVKNVFRYLNLMFFPLQYSPLLETSPRWIEWLYTARTLIRTFLALSIISYSFFGFVFGSRAIRFFIAWTYITLLPFTSHTDAGQWLNLSHLYLTSLGLCVILAAGANGCSALLERSGWKRLLPYAVPLAFVAMSIGVSQKLDAKNKAYARDPEAVELRARVEGECSPGVPGAAPNTPAEGS